MAGRTVKFRVGHADQGRSMRNYLVQPKCQLSVFVAGIILCWTAAVQAASCPEFSERMQLTPDSDLLKWPVVQDITSQDLLYGRQTITQARRCEEAGELERAANYYVEAEGLLGRALSAEYRKILLDKSAALRARPKVAEDSTREGAPGRGDRDTDAVPDSGTHRDACSPSGYHSMFDEGIPPRKAEAIKLVEQGCALYMQGKAADAAKLYLQAAEQYKDAVAQFRLGMLYESGQGLQQDLTQAQVWLQRAGDQGMQPAMNELFRLNPPPPRNQGGTQWPAGIPMRRGNSCWYTNGHRIPGCYD